MLLDQHGSLFTGSVVHRHLFKLKSLAYLVKISHFDLKELIDTN